MARRRGWQTRRVGTATDAGGKAQAPARRFDDQADDFDRRAGVPPDQALAIAQSVLAAGRPGGEVVFELGVGTGELGRHLAALADRYVGVDLSWPMLEVFRSKLGTGGAAAGGPLLVHADGERHWPVAAATVTVVFASRAAHLLTPAHVVSEVRRVCRPGGRVVVGRVERTGVKQVLRRRREDMLAERGIRAARPGGRRTRELLDALATGGGRREPPRTVATWATATTAEEVLSGWEAMPTIGGEAVAPDVRAGVLAELRRWARSELGDLDAPGASAEQYTLEGVRLG